MQLWSKYFIMVLLFLQLFFYSTPSMAYTTCVGVEDGDVVVVEYIGVKESDGEIFDSTKNRGPATFTVSDDQLILGFYKGLLGMVIGDSKNITVIPSEGYTSPSHELYGETLIFDVDLQSVTSEIRECDSNGGGNNAGQISLNFNYFVIFVSIFLVFPVARKSLSKE